MDGLLRPNLVASHLVVVKVGMMEVHSEDDISLEIEVVCIIGKKSSSSLWLEEHVEAPVDKYLIIYRVLYTLGGAGIFHQQYHDNDFRVNTDSFNNPCHPCMLYLPTNLPQKSTIHVGKYTSPMDGMGNF